VRLEDYGLIGDKQSGSRRWADPKLFAVAVVPLSGGGQLPGRPKASAHDQRRGRFGGEVCLVEPCEDQVKMIWPLAAFS
jgi:hypothetical protein